MTEPEWLTCANPQPMLMFLRGKVSERKLRLFAVACCRRFTVFSVGRLGQGVEVAEQFADGRAGEGERRAVLNKVRSFGQDYDEDYNLALAVAEVVGRDDDARDLFDLCHAASLAVCSALESPVDGAALASQLLRLPVANGLPRVGERAAQADLVREIFGNPFRRVRPEPSWLLVNDGSAGHLARMSYDDRDWTRMPYLGDALEDAGCADHAILTHCRSNSQHVRGCWVVDQLLDNG
jgi:hypothetical protein